MTFFETPARVIPNRQISPAIIHANTPVANHV